MAQLIITELYTIGGNMYHEWTSWKVFEDEARTMLLVENIEDSVNKIVWDDPLMYSNGDMYNGDEELFASVQIKFNGKIGPWVDMEGCSISKGNGLMANCVGFKYPFPIKFGCKK